MRARALQLAPFFFERSRPHTFRAFVSFCTRVGALPLLLPAGFTGSGARFPAPENVALGAGPKISGCGDGAALHESPEEHSGGEACSLGHGTPSLPQTCASYTA